MGFSLPKNLRKDPGMNPYESSPAKCREDKLEVGPFFSERAHTTLKWIWNPNFKQFTFYDISRVAKTGWRWENQRCTFVLGEDILVHPWRTSANCDLFECYFCVLEMHDTHFWHFFGVFVGGTVCAKAQPKKQGKRALKKTPLLEDVMYFYILRMNFHLFKNHMDVESLQKTGISRMVGYQIVGWVLFFQLWDSSSQLSSILLRHGWSWSHVSISDRRGVENVFCI